MSEPRLLVEGAAPGTHEAVLNLITEAKAHGRTLDAPCGSGALSLALTDKGLDVFGVDVAHHPELKLPQDRLTVADLDAGVPYGDAHFDTVISVEGIEHLGGPRAFVQELARVLRPGGTLIISTPNVLSIRSRWRWLSRGYHRHFTPDAQGRFSSEHVHAIDYVLLYRMLKDAGLSVRAVKTNRLQANLRDRIVAWWVRYASKKHPFAKELLSDELLFGQILVVHAVKDQV